MMNNFLEVIEHIILKSRCDSLTLFFKIFPAFVSPYFYIFVIALAYWSRSYKNIFQDLIVLIPISTLLNAFLKNIYRVPRPTAAEHLILVHDPYGFPSGDAQLATIFWGLILIRTPSLMLRLLCVCMIGLTGVSRIYLGVHRAQEVIAGIAIALLTLFSWDYFIKKRILSFSPFWYVIFSCFAITAYLFVSFDLEHNQILGLSLGSLMALLLCWQEIIKYAGRTPLLPAVFLLLFALLAVHQLDMLEFLMPEYMITSLKIMSILVSIFKIIPWLLQQNSRS